MLVTVVLRSHDTCINVKVGVDGVLVGVSVQVDGHVDVVDPGERVYLNDQLGLVGVLGLMLFLVHLLYISQKGVTTLHFMILLLIH